MIIYSLMFLIAAQSVPGDAESVATESPGEQVTEPLSADGAPWTLESAKVVSSRYNDCVTLLEADLEIGRIAAQQWSLEGGGAEAQHCLAIADSKAGFHKLAAIRLDDLAERKDAGDDYMRARILSQAVALWLKAGEIDRAENSLGAALALTPDSGELQLTAAAVFAVQEEWNKTVNAVTAAEDSGFVSASGFIRRGRAQYEMGAYRGAADDVVRALSLDPVNIDALTLRGDIQRTGITIDVFYDVPQ